MLPATSPATSHRRGGGASGPGNDSFASTAAPGTAAPSTSTRHRRTSSGQIGLLDAPPGSAFADQLSTVMRRAARVSVSRESLETLAGAGQLVADHLQRLVTEHTSLAAMEGASLVLAEALALLKTACTVEAAHTRAAAATGAIEEVVLAALGILVPLTYSPALTGAKKLLPIDSCLQAVVERIQTPLSAALFAQAVDALIVTEGSSPAAAVSAGLLIDRAAEPVAALATACLVGDGFSTSLPGPEEARVVCGLRTLHVAVLRAPHLLASVPIALAWAIVLAGHPLRAVREAAAGVVPELLSAAARDGRAVAVAHAAVSRLHPTAGARTGGAAGATALNDDELMASIEQNPFTIATQRLRRADSVNSLGADAPNMSGGFEPAAAAATATAGGARPHSPHHRSQPDLVGSSPQSHHGPPPAASSGSSPMPTDRDPSVDAHALFAALPDAVGDLAALAVVDAAISVQLLRDETVDVALCLVSEICSTRLQQALGETSAQPGSSSPNQPSLAVPSATRRAGSPSLSRSTTPSALIGGLQKSASAGAFVFPPTVAEPKIDETLAAALKCLLTMRRVAGRQFRRHVLHDANGQQLRTLLRRVLEASFERVDPFAASTQTVASLGRTDDSPGTGPVSPATRHPDHAWFSVTALRDARIAPWLSTGFVVGATPDDARAAAFRRLLFTALTFTNELECQQKQSTLPLHEVSPLVVRELASWLRWYDGADRSSTRNSFAATPGSVEATIAGANVALETVPEPSCSRLAASCVYLCADDPTMQPLLHDISRLAACCHTRLTATPSTTTSTTATTTSNSGSSARSSGHGSGGSSSGGGGRIMDVLYVAASTSPALREVIVSEISIALRDAVCGSLQGSDSSTIRSALRSCEHLGATESCAKEVLEHTASMFELAAADGASSEALLHSRGLHVTLTQTGVFALRQLETYATERGGVSAAVVELAERWAIAVLRFATTGATLSGAAPAPPRDNSVRSGPRGFPADVVCTLRAVCSTGDSLRLSPPFSYMFVPGNIPARAAISPVLLHRVLAAPVPVQLLACLAAANHPVSAAAVALRHRPVKLGHFTASSAVANEMFDDGSTGNHPMSMGAPSAASGSAAGGGRTEGAAMEDSLVLLCRASLVSPGGILPLLRQHILAAVTALTSTASDCAKLLGKAPAYSGLAQRPMRRLAERMLTTLFREAPRDLTATYAVGVLHAVAVSSGLVGDAATDASNAGKMPALSHMGIALVAHVAPVAAAHNSDTFRRCTRALFDLALRDPAPLTVLHCTVALAAIVRCVTLPPGDGHAALHYCLSKLRRLGDTPADGTLKRSLLRLSGAVGAGLLLPPRKLKVKGDYYLASAAHLSAIASQLARRSTGGAGGGVGSSSLGVPAPTTPEEAKQWPGRVVLALLRDIVAQHGDSAPTQTRFALRGLCDITVAMAHHLVHVAQALPPILDEVLNCLKSTSARLARPLLDGDAHSVLHVAELCVSLVTLLMYAAPWLRGRLADVAEALVTAGRVNTRGVLQLAIGRGWVVIAQVAPSVVATHLGWVVAAQVRALSAPPPTTVAEVVERQVALDVLDSLGARAAPAAATIARCLLEVAEHGTATDVGSVASTAAVGPLHHHHHHGHGHASPLPGVSSSGEVHVVDVKLRAVVSLGRFLIAAATTGPERHAVAPLAVAHFTRLVRRLQLHPTDVSHAAQVQSHSVAMSLLRAPVSGVADANYEAVLEKDAVGFMAAVLVSKLCSPNALQSQLPYSTLFTPQIREIAAKCAASCADLSVWPFEKEDRSSTSSRSGTSGSSSARSPQPPANSARRSPYTVEDPVADAVASAGPSLPRSALVRAVRSSASHRDQQAQWEPANLVISDPNATDAVPRIAKELAPHSPVLEVRACAEVVELSPEIARSLFHVIALPYMTEKVTDDVRATLFKDALLLARSNNAAAKNDARLLLSAVTFAEHEAAQSPAAAFISGSNGGGRDASPGQTSYTLGSRRGSHPIGHMVPRGAAPKLPTAWAEAPLLKLCEAALRVGDVATAAVFAEAALQQALQALRGDDRVSWVIRRGCLTFASGKEALGGTSPTPSGAATPPYGARTPQAANAPAAFGASPSATLTAHTAALANLSDVCTMLLRVSSLNPAPGASEGLVESLSELLETASSGISLVSLIVPPAVFQALDMHGRALEAFDRIGGARSLKVAASRAKSLFATGQMRECITFCRDAIRESKNGGGGSGGGLSSLSSSANPSPTGPFGGGPLSGSHPQGGSAAPAAAAASLPAATVDLLVDDPGSSDELGPRDSLCGYAAFSAWSLGAWDELSDVLDMWAEVSPSHKGPPSNDHKPRQPSDCSPSEGNIAATVNARDRFRGYYQAVLALARGNTASATRWIQRCWELSAEVSPYFTTSNEASLASLNYATADLQHLAELEEVAVVAEDPTLQSIAQRHWLKRLDIMTAAPSIRSGLTQQWQRSLAVLSLALPVAVNADPFLKLVRVARKQGEVELARTTMRRVLQHLVDEDVGSHTAEYLWQAFVDPKVFLAVAKCHVEFSGDAALATWAVTRYLTQRSELVTSNTLAPMEGKTLSKCFRKLAKWEERTTGPDSIRDSVTRIAISSHHFHAVGLNPDYGKPWKRWAVHNLKVAKLLYPWELLAQRDDVPWCVRCRRACAGECKRRALIYVSAHVHCALRGFVTVLELGGSSVKIENILNACNILFDYGAICSVSRALESVPFRIPVAAWAAVVPQLVARVLDARPRVRKTVHEILLRLGCASPQDVLIPLLATRQTCHSESVDASAPAHVRTAAAAGQNAVENLLNSLRAAPAGDEAVVQCAKLVAGMNYLSVLTVEQQYFSIVQAMNARRSSADDAKLVGSLEAILRAYQANAVPFDTATVSTGSLPVVRPLVAFAHDRHARHCSEMTEELWTKCHYAMGRYRMESARVNRARDREGPRPDVRAMARELQAMYDETTGQPKAGLHDDAVALRGRIAELERVLQQEKKEAYDRLVTLVKPFREVAAALDKYLGTVRGIDTREVHPPLAVADTYTAISMPGETRAGAPTIVSVDPRLHVMKSQQRPKQLRIVSSTGERRMYLLKGREDQRQDERVMQLFHFVNEYLAKGDTGGLTLHRFAVVPLSHTAGLIEWVPDAPTFGSIIREHRGGNADPKLTHPEREVLNAVLHSYADYDRLTIQQKVDTFTSLVESTDCTDFRRWMRLGARNAQAYIASRRAYADSLATTSMVGYVLGLGDRHPNNFLVRSSDCRVVHIDFGDCFEAAQLRTRIPESVPFRLTRQLAAALDLSGVRGGFRAASEQVVRAMRRHRAGVLALLDSFVHDPTVDWRLAEEGGANTNNANGGAAPVPAPEPSQVAQRARNALRRVELKLLGMEGAATVDINRAAFYNSGSSTATQRSMDPRLCDCSTASCAMPDAKHRLLNAGGAAGGGPTGGSFASQTGDLDDADAATAVQRWWRQQLHRRLVLRQPDFRFKPTAVNYEASIRRNVRRLDPRFPSLQQHEISERARIPVYDLWMNDGDGRSELSSEGGHITPPTFHLDPNAGTTAGSLRSPVVANGSQTAFPSDPVASTGQHPDGGAAPPSPSQHGHQQHSNSQRAETEVAQVRKIIGSAVDEGNLARLYSGWFPWW